MDITQLMQAVRAECATTTGCTDPGCVALAASRARRELGADPQRIDVTISPDLFKNGVSVGIPGTAEHGLDLAAALGSLVDNCDAGLAVLAGVDDDLLRRAHRLVDAGNVSLKVAYCPDPLYVCVQLSGGDRSACAEIRGDYTNITRVTRDGKTVFSASSDAAQQRTAPLAGCSVRELYDLILAADVQQLAFLGEYARVNWAAAQADLAEKRMKLGPLLKKQLGADTPADSVRVHTAAAAEARMQGLNVTIMAIAGSGNHGITDFVGVCALAQALGSSDEQLCRALAISSMITVYIKGYIHRMTAFCGCAVAAATGVAAAAVYLMGGSYEQGVNAMHSVIGTLGGMFCDGAKISCAYKLSTAAAAAVSFAQLAMADCYIPARVGIIGATIEQTFENIGRLNDPGMVETEKEIIAVVRRNQQQQTGSEE